jgi:hypothetical protein
MESTFTIVPGTLAVLTGRAEQERKGSGHTGVIRPARGHSTKVQSMPGPVPLFSAPVRQTWQARFRSAPAGTNRV